MTSSTDPYGDGYEIRVGVPDVATFRALRRDSGLSDRSVDAVALALPNTWHGVTVHEAGSPVPVGMGRVVGDGGCCFQIVDICVLPAHQGRGLGKRVMAALTDALERRAPATAYVSLIADGDARHLYAKFGFAETAPMSVGMQRVI